jgi:hypothetical protein
LKHALLLGCSTQATHHSCLQGRLYVQKKKEKAQKLSAVCDVSNPLVKNLGADFTVLANNPCFAVSRPTLSNRQHNSLRTPITTDSLLQKWFHTLENTDRPPQELKW